MKKLINNNGVKSVLYTILGAFITASAVALMITPNKIVGGGVSGLSTILYHTLSVPLGITFGVFNAVALLISLKVLGKTFVLKTLFGSALLSALVEVISHFPPITSDPFVAALIGGVLYGIGIGLVLANGFSTGGTEIPGRLLQYFFPHIQIGKLLMLVDGAIIFTSLVVFKNIELAVLGVVMMVVSSFAIDWVIRQFNISKVALVISDKGEEISKYLISTSPRGVTLLDSKGAYTGKDNKTLLCALKSSEMEEFKNKISELDSEAFTIFMESQAIIGNGFRYYK